MTMPVMEPELDAEVLRDWAQAIDDGPFSSLCWGERMAFDNPETLTLMGALAAWTDRVRLVTTVMVPQLHDPVMLPRRRGAGIERSACQNRDCAGSDDHAGDGAGIGRRGAAGLGAGDRRRTVLVVVLG
ncbi:MAG TPA: LLM class flavin-dependent oxidoreductase, partial [Mycobacterium sp.]|nr:LLM class flavin-dependent oxidoreductase [Mycobacterium sp.]